MNESRMVVGMAWGPLDPRLRRVATRRSHILLSLPSQARFRSRKAGGWEDKVCRDTTSKGDTNTAVDPGEE
jgi:hypothetical protein